MSLWQYFSINLNTLRLQIRFRKLNHIKLQNTLKEFIYMIFAFTYFSLTTILSKMSSGSLNSSGYKQTPTTYQNSYITTDYHASNVVGALNNNNSSYMSYSIPSKSAYTQPQVNIYQKSRLSPQQVNSLTGSRVNTGQVVKGQSRVQYVPYQKKYVDYEQRSYVQRVPKVRKVVDYEQRKIIQNIPREVIKQDFIAVQKITQYVKEIIPERKIQMVAVEKKVKKLEYIPVEKQIVHYPENTDFRSVRGQSRAVLENQGVFVRPDAEFKPLAPDLIYKYSGNSYNQQSPVGYVDLGQRRFLSTQPTYITNNLSYSRVASQYGHNLPQYIGPVSSSHPQPLQFQNSYVYSQPSQTIINRVNTSQSPREYNNVISGNKYEYRYGDVNLSNSRSNSPRILSPR